MLLYPRIRTRRRNGGFACSRSATSLFISVAVLIFPISSGNARNSRAFRQSIAVASIPLPPRQFTIGGARQRLAGDEAREDVTQSQQIVRQLRAELEELLRLLRR